MDDIIIKFGGGLSTRASEDEIKPQECADGKNFALDPFNRMFRNRKPYDLIGIVPNASEIRGLVNLVKTDGTSSILVQAADTVYEWDGATTFTSKGTVSATAKLRGRQEHNWQLTNKVLITDLNLVQPVMEWDGTTLQDVSFLSNPSTAWTGDFKARYCTVIGERAIFSNVNDNGTALPHMIVGTARSDYATLSVSDRPSSSISDADPWFLLQPDFRYINGMVNVWGQVVTSSREGSLFKLTGTTAQDYAMTEFFPRSGADGAESMVNVGNDMLYGRKGRIESLVATDKFGDVDINDITSMIYDQIETHDDWTLVYNQRNQRVYCYSSGTNELWVLHKSMIPTELSPWSRWTTAHDFDMTPTAMLNMIDPADGVEYVYFGDATGRFYRMEGTGSGDAGANDISVERLSPLIDLPPGHETFMIDGWVSYRTNDAFTLTLDFEFAGTVITTSSFTLDVPAVSNRTVYGGSSYYNNGEGYGSFAQRITRQLYGIPGQSDALQIRAKVSSSVNFEVKEIGIRITTEEDIGPVS